VALPRHFDIDIRHAAVDCDAALTPRPPSDGVHFKPSRREPAERAGALDDLGLDCARGLPHRSTIGGGAIVWSGFAALAVRVEANA